MPNDGYIRVAIDSAGKKLDTSELTVGLNVVERQRLVLADATNSGDAVGVTAGALNVNVITGATMSMELAPHGGMATGGNQPQERFAAVDGFIQVPPDSTGKRLDMSELLVGFSTVERQRVVIADSADPAGFAGVSGGALNVNIVSGGISYSLINVPSTASPVFNWSQSVHQRSTMISNIAPIFMNPSAAEMTLILVQDSTGGWNVTWPVGVKAGVTLDTTPATSTVLKFIFDGTYYLLMSIMGGM